MASGVTEHPANQAAGLVIPGKWKNEDPLEDLTRSTSRLGIKPCLPPLGKTDNVSQMNLVMTDIFNFRQIIAMDLWI